MAARSSFPAETRNPRRRLTWIVWCAGIAIVMNFASYWWSDKMALKMSRAEPLAEADDPRLYALVRDLAQRAELPMPRLFLIPQEQPNAFATGRNEKHAAVAVTAGLRRHMPEDQLAGVLAHELAHIKNHDILIQSIGAMIAGVISGIANWLQFSFLFGGGILDGAGKMAGGVLIVDFESRADIDEWLANEPYILNKVWNRVEVHPFLVPPQFLSLFPKYRPEPVAG